LDASQGDAIGKLHDSTVLFRRIAVLRDRIAPLIPEGAYLLDVGCGDGLLSQTLAEARSDIRLEGVDVKAREGAPIPIRAFDGTRLPYEDGSFDAVLFVDVLHHAVDPDALLREACRVTRRVVLVKDHTRNGLLAGVTLRFMDWVGNAHRGVALPYNYLTRREWMDTLERVGLRIELWDGRPCLYPRPGSWIFGRSLHFIARLAPIRPGAAVH
jgi:SAM-dependent methyltransferase